MSAIVAGLIPKIEGFQPIPNAVMIPFMEAQSAALAYGFGLNYEYGKRKIRSMSNDEFNSLTSEDITNMSNNHTHIILSKFQDQVPNVMPMQATIFTQYVAIEKLKVRENVELAKWVLQFAKSIGDDITAHLLGGHLHDELTNPYVTDPNKFINPITGEQGAIATPSPPPPPPAPTTTTTSTRPIPEHDLVNAEALEWIKKRDFHIMEVGRARREQKKYTTTNDKYDFWQKQISIQLGHLRTMSNDYRNPNPQIGKLVLQLRQMLANNMF